MSDVVFGKRVGGESRVQVLAWGGFSLSLLIIFMGADSGAQMLERRHDQIRRAVIDGRWTEVEKRLLELRRIAPRTFARHDDDYLLGRAEEQLGKDEAAARAFQRVVRRRSVLAAYALWHLAQLARSQGALAREQSYLRRLLAEYGESLLVTSARWRLARSYAESGQDDRAIALYRILARGRGRRGREARLEMARLLEHQGERARAVSVLKRLIQRRSGDDVALSAAIQLDEWQRRGKVALSAESHLQLARVYQANREFAAARHHYRWVLEHVPAHPEAAEAVLAIAMGYYREGKIDRARQWFQRAVAQYPQTAEGEQAMYWIGHTWARVGEWLKAVRQYKRFIAAHPRSRWIPGAYLNIIDALRSAGMNGEALIWCQRTMERFPGELAATTALFSQARIHLVQRHYRAALRDFDELLKENLSRPGPRAPNRPEVVFMRGYCLEKLGRYKDALDVYLSLSEERQGYYGYRATARLRQFHDIPRARPLLLARYRALRRQAHAARVAGRLTEAACALGQAWRLTRDASRRASVRRALRSLYRRLPEYRHWMELRPLPMERGLFLRPPSSRRRTHDILARALFFLGLYDEGAPELAAALRSARHQPSPAQWLTLAVAFSRGGRPDQAVKIGHMQLIRRLPEDYRWELLAPELLQILYPAPYLTILQRAARARHLDPRFMLAIMRQESRFRPDARSPAAARGLMQLTPATARRLAASLGKVDLDLDDLYEPETSIELAAAHLEELQRRFPQHLAAVAAAYNAGAGNVERWLHRAESDDPDRFVIEIGFRETKEYVYRVMANYEVYRRILPQGFFDRSKVFADSQTGS